MADLIDLGFELSAQKAESAIDRLMDKFNELEKTKSSVSKFEFPGLENLSQVAKQFRTISSSVTKINKMFSGAAASEDAKQVESLNIRIGETGKLMRDVGNYRFKTGAELAANEVKVFETSLNAAAAKLSELSVVQQKISYGGKSSTPAGMSQLAEQLAKLEGQIAPLGGSFQNTFTVITQAIGQAKTQAARFNGEVSKIAVSLNKTGTSIGKITAQMRQLAESVSRTALRTAATGSAMEKMASVNPVNPAAIASVDQLKMKLQEASLAARSFRTIGKIGGSVSVGGLRDMTGGFNQANFAARNLRDTLISMATGGGIAYYFADVTRAAVKFGEELSYIQSLTLDFSKQDMRAGILNMGSMLGDATKNAEAAYYAYSSGVRGGEKGIINFTGNMAKLAKIIRADVIPTVNSVTTIMNAYNLTAADSAELTDLFYGIIKQGKANGPQLASGLGQVASTAATADLSLNELGAAVASLTKVNSTRNAITYLNNMLSKMIKPTKEARLAAANLGIELGLDAVRAKGFTGMMQEIQEKTQGSQQALLALFPDLRGQRAALQLLNRGWDDFNKQLGFFANKAGIADEAFQNLEEDLNQQLGALPVTFNKIKIAAGDTITNILTLGGTLAPLIRDFNNMDESGQKLAGGIALVVGGLVTMKIAGLTLNTVKAMEIRNNAIILEQQKQERRNRAALTMAVAREAAAKKAAAAVTMPGVIPAAGKTAAARVSGVAANVSAPAVDGKAIASMQSYNALKLQLAEHGVRNASALQKEAAAEYARAAAIEAAAKAKAREASDTAALQIMMTQEAQWRMKMASVNQSHLGSLTAIGRAEKANATAAYQRAVSDERAARLNASMAVSEARRASLAAQNAKAGLDAANASLLSASMKEKEVLANAKLSASEIANMTAVGKGVLTRKQKLDMVDKILRGVAVEKSLMLDAARAEYDAAKAAGDAAAIRVTKLNLMKAEQEFMMAENAAAKGRIAYMKAENKLIAAQNAQLAVNVGLNRKRAVGNSFTKIIEGQGFIGGFGRSGVANLREVRRMLKFEGLGLSMSKLGAGVGKLSASFLGLIPIITKIGIVAGAVAAVGGLIDIITSPKIDNGLNAAGNSRIVGAIADKLYNFFTGAFDKANEFTERMKMLAESREKDLEVMSVLTKMTDSVMVYAENTPQKTGNIVDQLKKNFENSMGVLKSANYQGMQTELTNLLKQRKELQDKIKKGFNLTETLKLVNEKNKANLKIVDNKVVADTEVVVTPQGVPVYNRKKEDIAALKEFENLRKAAGNWNNELKKTEERIDTLSPMLEKAKEQPLKYGKQVIEILDKQREAVQSINSLIDERKFQKMSAPMQLLEQISKATVGYFDFLTVLGSGTTDAGMIEKSFKSFIKPATDAVSRLQKNIESFDKMIESTMNDAFRYRLDGAKTDTEQIKMMQNRANKLMKESGITVKQDTWAKDFQARVRKAMTGDIVKNDPKMMADYQKLLKQTNPLLDNLKIKIPKDPNFDLQKSYSKVTESIRLQVDAKKTEIERYKQLAEAELRANEKTLDLIRSMDKMSVTAVDAVDATSLDAVKLQSRSFIELPQMNFAQNAENDLGSAQQDLRKIYNDAAKIVEAFTKAAEDRKRDDEKTQTGLEERILKAFELVQERIKNLDTEYKDQQKDIFNRMQEYEKNSAEALKKLEENSTTAKTRDEKHQQNAETSLRDISNNTRVFKDWQKVTV